MHARDIHTCGREGTRSRPTETTGCPEDQSPHTLQRFLSHDFPKKIRELRIDQQNLTCYG